MLFVLITSILSTLLYVNIVLTDFINAKVNPYIASETDKQEDTLKAKLKLILIIIMSIFWAVYISY